MSLIGKRVALLGALAFFIPPAPSAFAEEPVHTRVSLVSSVDSIQPGTPFDVAVRLEMDEHWHTYWKNPGDSGGPTEVDWRLPAGFSSGSLQWPYPNRIVSGPLVSFGYEDETALLATLTPPADLPTSSVKIAARVSWLECADVCIPREADVSLTLPVSRGRAAVNEASAEFFARYRSRIPIQPEGWSLRAEKRGDGFRLFITPPDWHDGDPGDIFFFPDGPGQIVYGAEQPVSRVGDEMALGLAGSDLSATADAALSGVLVAGEGWRGPGSERAMAVRVPVEPAGADTSLLLILLFAFVGGALLNLMPCVLPVLSIKILGLLNRRPDEGRAARRHGALYAAGILAAFWILAGIMLAVREGGRQLGWGFQLQSPAFVGLMALLFTLIALNFFGVFEFGVSLTRIGGTAVGRRGRSDAGAAFFSGVLATIVATPCTAPFMGTALGVALTQPGWIVMAIFTSLGLGLAIPYVLLSSTPRLVRYLPTPGPWMVLLKQALGFIMLGAVVWLVWVFAQQTGIDQAARLLLALLTASVGMWVWGVGGLPTRSGGARMLSALVAVALVVGAAVWLGRSLADASGRDERDAGAFIEWEPYSAARVDALRQAGTPLFIDFTAAWCLTCKVNEKVVFSRRDVAEAVKASDLVMMKADWTKRDETVTRALQSFGRNGVPLYVLYSAEADAPPVLLPEILTPKIFLDAVLNLEGEKKTNE